MRKLSRIEVATLVVGAVVGLHNVYADEPGQLEQIVVTATRPPLVTVNFTGTIPSLTSNIVLSSPTTIQIASYAPAAHAWSCAVAYGGVAGAPANSPAAHSGPNNGTMTTGAWGTYFSNNYGWGNSPGYPGPPMYISTTTSTPPAGTGAQWGKIDGFTSPALNGNQFVGGYTIMFMPTAYVATSKYSANANFIDLLAHEWSHQWGSQDISSDPNFNAYTIGHAARDAYLKDKGAKCGGL